MNVKSNKNVCGMVIKRIMDMDIEHSQVLDFIEAYDGRLSPREICVMLEKSKFVSMLMHAHALEKARKMGFPVDRVMSACRPTGYQMQSMKEDKNVYEGFKAESNQVVDKDRFYLKGEDILIQGTNNQEDCTCSLKVIKSPQDRVVRLMVVNTGPDDIQLDITKNETKSVHQVIEDPEMEMLYCLV